MLRKCIFVRLSGGSSACSRMYRYRTGPGSSFAQGPGVGPICQTDQSGAGSSTSETFCPRATGSLRACDGVALKSTPVTCYSTCRFPHRRRRGTARRHNRRDPRTPLHDLTGPAGPSSRVGGGSVARAAGIDHRRLNAELISRTGSRVDLATPGTARKAYPPVAAVAGPGTTGNADARHQDIVLLTPLRSLTVCVRYVVRLFLVTTS